MKPLFFLTAGVSLATAATVNYGDDSCSDAQKAIIEDEMNHASDMAGFTAKDLHNGVYYDTFFSQRLRDKDDFEGKVIDVLNRVSRMAAGMTPDFSYMAKCDQTTKGCSVKKWVAHMSDGDSKVMNFCDLFFSTTFRDTNGLMSDCGMDLRAAQRGRAAVLVHEFTHTSYAMNAMDGSRTLDYTYGLNGAYELPKGTFDRSCAPYALQDKVLCPDTSGKESVCDGDKTQNNADTYSFVATGVFFSQLCKKAIPIPSPPAIAVAATTSQAAFSTAATSSNSSTISANATVTAEVTEFTPPARKPRGFQERRYAMASEPLFSRDEHNSCPINNDYIVIDGDDETTIGIEGYVAFGDSYGAGMGTGTTTGDACRVGSNNFGKLLHDWLGGDDVLPFERKVCSGDTTTGLNRQINEWSNTEGFNLGTVSMGGNNLNFSDLVWDCIVTPNTARLGSTNRANCVKDEKAARDNMNDLSENGLRWKLQDSYVRILEKSGRKDFHLYVTSYPSFFNYDTTDCDKTTFHYWWSGYNPSSDWPFNRIVYLTQDLRREIDDLVDELNELIRIAVDDANKAHGGQQIHFVDTNVRFSGNRWCKNDKGQWHEPDENVESTYFFLSAWKDLSIEGQVVDMDAAEEEELKALGDAGKIELPDASTCRAELGTDPDPYAKAMCRAAESIAEKPDGEDAEQLNQANADLANRDYHSDHVKWWAPTRQVKTFHPRSPGMAIYRDAIIEKIQEIGQI